MVQFSTGLSDEERKRVRRPRNNKPNLKNIPPGDVLIALPTVLTKTGLSEQRVWERIKEGTFPKPVEMGPRSRRWVLSEVDQWIADRIAERDNKQKPQSEENDA